MASSAAVAGQHGHPAAGYGGAPATPGESAKPLARSRQGGTGAAHEAATPVGKDHSDPTMTSSGWPKLASAPQTVAVQFDPATGRPLGVDPVPARSHAYWQQAEL